MTNVAVEKARAKGVTKRDAVLEDLSLEAFLLSPQAVELYKRGVLRKHYSAAQPRSHKLQLQGEVLVQSDTVSEIDPLLFAIPVPIAQAERAPNNAGSRAASAKSTADGWEHLFPTLEELQSLGGDAKLRKYLHKVLVRLSKKRWPKSQLRDFNLLLSLQSFVGSHDLSVLCDALSDPKSDALPKQISLALETLKESLVDDNDDEGEEEL